MENSTIQVSRLCLPAKRIVYGSDCQEEHSGLKAARCEDVRWSSKTVVYAGVGLGRPSYDKNTDSSAWSRPTRPSFLRDVPPMNGTVKVPFVSPISYSQAFPQDELLYSNAIAALCCKAFLSRLQIVLPLFVETL